ncbi:EamA family transporter [Paraferrimonas sedimenticola]|uniref:4-amino-4-deoxy-L-arabinose-phosphoundecaprenol flippase subunit ArnE n=1 Tax=Paraferrimonas sedimenticola TaxID=375674 RepID=A0AA37RXR4_9GAMM|nr:EamA family transporter [Paraferrimonas sedimenticola]GLP97416.1 putative 4-amino-4-deoxy-L-arabinose-phosphoundecaprenol flippase subunit ArnE [Paraferrimonas sedimenticola]
MWPWLWIGLSISLTCLGQIAQKQAVTAFARMPAETPLRAKLLHPWLITALFALGFGALFWLLVLHVWPVGQAYPLLATNFVLMLLIARFGFKETVNKRRWLGGGLVAAGIVCMGLTL